MKVPIGLLAVGLGVVSVIIAVLCTEIKKIKGRLDKLEK